MLEPVPKVLLLLLLQRSRVLPLITITTLRNRIPRDFHRDRARRPRIHLEGPGIAAGAS